MDIQLPNVLSGIPSLARKFSTLRVIYGRMKDRNAQISILSIRDVKEEDLLILTRRKQIRKYSLHIHLGATLWSKISLKAVNRDNRGEISLEPGVFESKRN